MGPPCISVQPDDKKLLLFIVRLHNFTPMRRLNIFFPILAFILCAAAAQAASGRIIKVLPHYLDLDGHHSLSPSLYERDAYQAKLRKSPELCSGIRYDVQWKARGATAPKLRVEIRTAKTPVDQPKSFEQPVRSRGWFRRWSSVTVQGKDFHDLGTIVSWRVLLLQDDHVISEQKSFLW